METVLNRIAWIASTVGRRLADLALAW